MNQLSKFERLKLWSKQHKRAIQAFLFISILFFGIGLFINPINASSPYQTRNKDIATWTMEHGYAWMQCTADFLAPEGDSQNGTILTHKEITFRIPITVEALPIMEEFDAKGEALPFNLMENLQFERGKFYDSMMLQQIYAYDLSKVYWSDNYPNYTEYTPFAQRQTLLLNEPRNYIERYQAMVPSPAQFCQIIAQKNGWILNNISKANTQYMTGSGIRPSYVTQSFGTPCEIDNDTSNMVIELKASNESDWNTHKGYIGIQGSASYQTFYCLMYDEEHDDWLAPTLLGSYYVYGIVPHQRTIIQHYDGQDWKTIASLMIDRMLKEKETDSEGISSKNIWDDLLGRTSFGLMGLIIGVLLGNDVGLDEGYDQGHAAGVDETVAKYSLELYKIQQQLNLSKQQIEGLLDALDRVSDDVKANYTNPYEHFGGGSLAGSFKMPSFFSIGVILTIAIVVGCIIFVLVWFFFIKKRRKGKQEKSEGAEVQGSPESGGIRARISSGFGRAGSKMRGAGSTIKRKIKRNSP